MEGKDCQRTSPNLTEALLQAAMESQDSDEAHKRKKARRGCLVKDAKKIVASRKKRREDLMAVGISLGALCKLKR